MSQGQPRRPQQGGQDQTQLPQQQQQDGRDREPIRYGEVFNVSGDLATRPVAPEDAKMMQIAETRFFGQTQKGGVAATMQAAATYNERAGIVGHRDLTDAAGSQGVTVTEADLPGVRIVTERVAGQVVGQYVDPTPVQGAAAIGLVQSSFTIGEAQEASARTAGDKPIDYSDAAAIQAAEVRATGSSVIIPGGLAATAQSVAATHDEDKIKLNPILTGATATLPADKVVTRADVEGVMGAELRNNPNPSTHPGGVAASMTAAARLNENANA